MSGNPDLGSFSGGVELVTGSFDPGDIPEWTGAAGNVFEDASQVVPASVQTTVRIVRVPEPAAFALLALCAVPVGLVRCRRSK